MAAPAIPPFRPGLTTSRGCTVPCGRLGSDAINHTTVFRGTGNDGRVELADLTT